MKRQIYFLLLASFVLMNNVFSNTKPDKIQAKSLNSTNGITVIVHGFQVFGSWIFPSDFLNYAQKIRTRLNGNATIYVNKSSGNRFYWEKVSGTGSGEKIFVYVWGDESNTVAIGSLEAAADKLFCLLTDPYDEKGNKIARTAELFDKPSHFIAHSRGNIVCLQTFLRIGKYFPNKQITQFTLLDPHPAAYMGDIALPAVNGIGTNCTPPFCSGSNQITIDIPANVSFADCYYRKKGIYEQLSNFDGVKANGASNTELKDATLLQGGNSSMPHSLVHEWYFGTVDLSTTLPNSWYAENGRQNSGWYNSRLGGGGFKNGNGRISIGAMENKIKTLQGRGSLSEIFNGNILYEKGIAPIPNPNTPTNWKAIGFNGANVINTNEVLTPNFNNQTRGEIIYNSLFYVPKSKKFLKFDINSTNINPNTHIMFQWHSGGNIDDEGSDGDPVCAPQQAGTKTYYVEVPPVYFQKTATFKIVFRSSVAMGNFSLDNFELTDSPNGSDAIAGYCCNFNLTIDPASPPTLCQGESVTLSASDGADTYIWRKDGVQVGNGKTYTANAKGSYSVVGTKNAKKCNAAASVSVNVVDNTTINFKINGALPNSNPCAFDSTSKTITLCAGQSTTLTGTGCEGVVTWNTGVTANAITVNQAGNYEATCRIGQNCQKSDNVVVKIETATTPTVANAGTDNAYCGKQAITLDGNVPTAGCGTWSIVSPTGADVGSFSDIHNPTATFSPKQFGTYRLQWTISLVCGNNSSSDLVDLNFVESKVVKELRLLRIDRISGMDVARVVAFPQGGIFHAVSPYYNYNPTSGICYDNKICSGTTSGYVLNPNSFTTQFSYKLNTLPCPVSEKKINIFFKGVKLN
jgi:hypothetical protein